MLSTCVSRFHQSINQSTNPSINQALAHIIASIIPRTIIMAVGVVSSSVPFGVKNVIGSATSDQFEGLVLALKEALGPSSGLTSDDVDVGFLTRLMIEYDSNPAEWSKYAFGDGSRGYTRNLVDEGNGKSNLVSDWRCPTPLSQGNPC